MIAVARKFPLPEWSPFFENGDMLTRAEFLRRYDLSDMKRVELIEGVVHMPSPVRILKHSAPDGLLHVWLGTYAAAHDLEMYPNATVLLDAENSFQPDAILCSTPRKSGRVWINQDDFLCGAPELVVEISASSASIDLRDKLRVYRRSGVSEYIVWRTVDREIDWFVLDDGQYVKLPSDRHGRIHSRMFKGLVLDTVAALKMDKAKVLAALRR
jgi:Uma2 family endonuclease